MPLSRLTPRSSRTGVARRKSRAQRDTQRHLHLWAAIRDTREQLDQWDRQAKQVDTLFNQHIVPREIELTQAVCAVTSQLITQFSSEALDIADQSLLGLWITDNLSSLQNHPFADDQLTISLGDRWRQLLNKDGPVENQLARLARLRSYEKSEEQTDYAHAKDDQTRADNKKKRDEPELADTIKNLEDKLSVEHLFRQLAKVLHPDREQDEEAKAVKNALMSQCLKARQENDIHALLTLYCEHVGELPDDLNNNSHTELVNALETQLKQLQIELRDKRFGDPLHTMIIERYSSSSSADSEQRVKNHAQSLDNEIVAANTLASQLEDHDGLLDALEERRAVEQDRLAINELTGM